MWARDLLTSSSSEHLRRRRWSMVCLLLRFRLTWDSRDKWSFTNHCRLLWYQAVELRPSPHTTALKRESYSSPPTLWMYTISTSTSPAGPNRTSAATQRHKRTKWPQVTWESDKYSHSRSSYRRSEVRVIQTGTRTRGLTISIYRLLAGTKSVGKEVQLFCSFNLSSHTLHSHSLVRRMTARATPRAWLRRQTRKSLKSSKSKPTRMWCRKLWASSSKAKNTRKRNHTYRKSTWNLRERSANYSDSKGSYLQTQRATNMTICCPLKSLTQPRVARKTLAPDSLTKSIRFHPRK